MQIGRPSAVGSYRLDRGGPGRDRVVHRLPTPPPGFHRYAQVGERLDVAIQIWNLEVCILGAVPVTPRERRQLADRAIYRAIRELKTSASHSLDETERAAAKPGRPDPVTVSTIRDRIEDSPVRDRIVVKLKLSEVFFPGLPHQRPTWRAEEASHLLRHHTVRLCSLWIVSYADV